MFQSTKNSESSTFENSSSVVVSANSNRQVNGNAGRVNKTSQSQQQRKPDIQANKSDDTHSNKSSHYGHTGRRQGGRRDDHRHHHNRRRHEFHHHHQNGTEQPSNQQPCGSNQRWQWMRNTTDCNGIRILWFFIQKLLWYVQPPFSTVIICLLLVYHQFVVIRFDQVMQWAMSLHHTRSNYSVFFHCLVRSKVLTKFPDFLFS